MKKIYTIILLSVLYAGGLSARNVTGDVVLVCNTLEERGQTLYLDMDVRIRRKAINTCQNLTIVPIITDYSANAKVFPSILINGNVKRKLLERQKKLVKAVGSEADPYMVFNVGRDADTVLRYTMAIPYEAWMDNASLVVREVLGSCADQEQLVNINMDRQVRRTISEPYIVKPAVTFVEPEKEAVKTRNLNAQAYLDYQSGRSAVDPQFRRNPQELARIRETIDEIKNNPDARITGIHIEGFSSPEGNHQYNERLSGERANTLMAYIFRTMGVDRNLMHVSAGGEDWPGLRQMIQNSNLQHRDAIIAMIDSDLAPDTKESHLKRYSSYPVMLNDMFPRLRRSEYRIEFTVRDYSVSEAEEVIGKDPSMLSHLELYNLANKYEVGSPEFFKVYETIAKYYSDDPAGAINIATVEYMKGNYDIARQKLEKLKDKSQYAMNNLGAVYLAEGNLPKAEELLTKARDMGSRDAGHNLEELRKKREDNAKQIRSNRKPAE